jgi:outer membrane protein TolC
VPLQQRTARARLSQSVAERNAIYQQQRQRQDEIEIEVRKIYDALVYAEELATLAGSEVELAETMRQAEQKRFKQGASDFFLVNVREEAAASARVSYLSASLETLVARVNFDAATLNLQGLGLPGAGL